MKQAKKGLIEAVIPGNTPKKVTDTERTPYWFTGLLTLHFPDGIYTGTGTLIMDGVDNETCYVLTCAHNLYDAKTNEEVTKVSFQRAFNDPNAPYGEIEAEKWFYPAEYPTVAIPRDTDLELLSESEIKADINYDYGLVKLKTAVNVSGLPLLVVNSTETLDDLAVQINGYGYYDENMSHATGKIKEVTATALRYPISTKVGASGSSIMPSNTTNSIVGIHTRAYSSTLNQGVRINAAVKAKIEKWMKS